jgi:hypothetical protein
VHTSTRRRRPHAPQAPQEPQAFARPHAPQEPQASARPHAPQEPQASHDRARHARTDRYLARPGGYHPPIAELGEPMEHLDHDRSPLVRLRRSEAGEGVISAAIAVLVMAFIGVMMWVAFSGSFDRAASSVDERIDQIGG